MALDLSGRSDFITLENIPSSKFNDEYDEFLNLTAYAIIFATCIDGFIKFNHKFLIKSSEICPDTSSNVRVERFESIKATRSNKLIDSLKSPFVI